MLMFRPVFDKKDRIQRVRAILITPEGSLLFIKRIKPNKPEPYWVAPGGGVESHDEGLFDALDRELREELGVKRYLILCDAFVLEHHKAGKDLQEHFFVCRLLDYDLTQRHGPEFDDPSRGHYIPDEVPLTSEAIRSINIKTRELRDWLLANLPFLQDLHLAA